jgi:hypothetical protein
MPSLAVDENGWAIGAVAPLAIDDAYSLLAPGPDARIDAARWRHQASAFFQAKLVIAHDKRYPSGTLPLSDALEIDIGLEDEETTTRVLVVTMPADRAPLVLKAGAAGAQAIGGAGFDALVARTRRIWQVRASVDQGDARAPLLVAAVLASLLLAPVVPPGGGAIFGVKGARERLSALGFRV